MINDELFESTAQELNDKYGSDLLHLEKCREIYASVLERQEFLKNELNLENESSNITKVLRKINNRVEEVDVFSKDSKEISKSVEEHLQTVDDIKSTINTYVDKIKELECQKQYMRVLQRIDELSEELGKEIVTGDDEKCATIYANLCEISRNLVHSKAEVLREFLKQTLEYWHKVLKEKLSRDLDEILKALKWPFVSTNFSLHTPPESYVRKLQVVAEYLLQIELPEECSPPAITSGVLVDFQPLCLPVELLLVPLRKRFKYHFYGQKQTNRIDKPEWYFTQVLSWIRDHTEFVSKWIQPVVDKMGLHHIDAKMELMCGLVQLAVEKLISDLTDLKYDDYNFSHCIDEALGFDKELRENYGYSVAQPGIVVVLTRAEIFDKWLKMEKKYAVEKMDMMLSSDNREAFRPIMSESDAVKITTCADMFVTLLQTITERYECLSQPGHQIQFLDMQLELLDDFRLRLLQIANTEDCDIIDSKLPMIANSFYYVENVLSDWGSKLHYIKLHFFKSQMIEETLKMSTSTEREHSEVKDETVFTDILKLYSHVRNDFTQKLTSSVMKEVKSRCAEYRMERWSSMKMHKDPRAYFLTPSACAMFEALATSLHYLEKKFFAKLFSIVCDEIAYQLDDYLFENIVHDNRFSEGGAFQFKFDITRNLFPLFSQFCGKPETFFRKLHESCILLNITKGSALLLRETLMALEGATGVEDRRGQVLKEIGVEGMDPKGAIAVLNRRTDITVERLNID